MDFKSPKGWNAAVGPLSVLDDHSRYLLVLQVCSAHGELVREQLEPALAICGVPQAMPMDHGIPYGSARAQTVSECLESIRAWLNILNFRRGKSPSKLAWTGHTLLCEGTRTATGPRDVS
jgi:hypothetical protein